MQLIQLLLPLFTLLTVCLAAPTHGTYHPHLTLALRETNRGRRNAHYGLIFRAGGSFTSNTEIREHVLDRGCMVFQNERIIQKLDEPQVVVEGPLLAAKGENSDAELIKAVDEVMKNVPSGHSIPLKGEFDNCLDFVLKAAQALQADGYIAQSTLGGFLTFHSENAAAVHAKTDAASRELAETQRQKAAAKAAKLLRLKVKEVAEEAAKKARESQARPKSPGHK